MVCYINKEESMNLAILYSCLSLASVNYSVPVDVLQAIHKVEGGWNGAIIKNTNGTVDMGAMQINSLWLKPLSQKWDMPKEKVMNYLVNDSCTSASVAAWILSENLKDSNGDMVKAVGWYHSRTPKFRDRYIKKVYSHLNKIRGASK